MNEQGFDKKNEAAGKQDNMAQPETGADAAEDALGAALNADDSIAGAAGALDTIAEEELEQVRTERDEAQDKYVRLVAEFENFRKRNARERVELIQTAGREIIQSLLEVLDDCDRAEKQVETSEDITLVREGVSLVFNKLRTTLQHKGLRLMDCLHQEFDPELHEAIAEIPAPSEELKGKVLDVTEPGYYLNDKLIRHARVVVGK